MDNEFNKVLDECIDFINSGEALKVCLDKYPDYAEKLEPLLKAAVQTREAYSFEVSRVAKEAAYRRFHAALDEIERRHEEKHWMISWLFGSVKVWAPAVAVTVIALVSFLVFGPALFNQQTAPGTSPTVLSPTPQIIATPQPSETGNFIFLISDEVNAIDDFKSLNITIEKIGIQLDDEGNQWIEFSPEVTEADLTQLKGTRAQEIWRGDIPGGKYNNVFIEVSTVSGILLESGEKIEIKLPSGKLHMSKPFEIESDEVINFVYDLTVVEAGKSGQYILKPQIDQSGADQDIIKVEPAGQVDNQGGKSLGKDK